MLLRNNNRYTWKYIIRNDKDKLKNFTDIIKNSKTILAFIDCDYIEVSINLKDNDWLYCCWNRENYDIEFGDYTSMIKYEYNELNWRSIELIEILVKIEKELGIN